ncbi:MAG: hypothetical protein OEZ34_00610 [Spirochaetia bacterium]|nr:hypothetical protein [Spirochaetia bacterium]
MIRKPIFFLPLFYFVLYSLDLNAQVFSVPQGKWKEKKGRAEIVIAPSHILFRENSDQEFMLYSYEIKGRIREEYWLEYTGKHSILNSDKITLIFHKYTIELYLFSKNKVIKKYVFKR